MQLPCLIFWPDTAFRGAAENMALDQAIFEHTKESGAPFLRSYCWDRPAVTVGYFHRFAPDEPSYNSDLGPIRRFTGGGKVNHGKDVTFLLTLPSESEPAALTAPERYRWIHQLLAEALNSTGVPVLLEQSPQPFATGPCFDNTVGWDLIDAATRKKMAGGAQRRSAGHVIHQGSIRVASKLRTPSAEWLQDFLQRLSGNVATLDDNLQHSFLQNAKKLTENRYSTPEWNRFAHT